MIAELINDVIKTICYIGLGSVFGFVLGLTIGISGLSKVYATLPSWLSIGFILMFTIGIFFIISLVKKDRIEEIRK